MRDDARKDRLHLLCLGATYELACLYTGEYIKCTRQELIDLGIDLRCIDIADESGDYIPALAAKPQK